VDPKTPADLNREFAERFIAQRCITDGEIRAELARLADRIEELKGWYLREQEKLQRDLEEYKEQVRAKHLEMNEVRRQINEERGQYELSGKSDARYDSIVNRMTLAENTASKLNGRLLGLGTALTILMVLLKFLFNK
jgi:predicted  nucleic acid-binding Zn-ribbon protein